MQGDNETLKIEQIDTTKEAKKFADEIRKHPKTYFLQGSWGSGKTEYLKSVKNQLHGKCKFIFLELWKPKDKKDISRKLFEAIHPFISTIFTLIYFCFVCLSVIGSAFLSYEGILSVKNKNIAKFILPITAIAIILVTLVKFVENKFLNMNSIFMKLSLFYLRKGRKRPIVLVIDDFDRLDNKTQEELYIIFNAIHEINWKWIREKISFWAVKYNNCKWLQKISNSIVRRCDINLKKKARIIFVGDLGNIKNIDKNYLGKIIDKKIILPYSLNPRFVSQRMEIEIKKVIKYQFDFSLVKNLFIYESRTIRDANQFLSYVENEFDSMNKKKSKVYRVQVDQELFIIYLYLFHREKYQLLLHGWLPDDTKDSDKKDNEEVNDNQKEDKKIEKTQVELDMDNIFQSRNGNPPDFRSNPSMYFVNELISTHSTVELKNYLGKTKNFVEKRSKLFLTKDSNNDNDYEEFLFYIENLSDNEFLENKTILETSAVNAMRSEIRHEPNELIKYVFEKRKKLIQKEYVNYQIKQLNRKAKVIFPMSEKDLIRKIDEIFDNYQKCKIIDTERMYYFRSCFNLLDNYVTYPAGTLAGLSEKSVQDYFSKTIEKVESKKDFGKKDYDAEVLIADLGYHYRSIKTILSKNPDFHSKVDLIEKLKDDEYVAFWNVYLKEFENSINEYKLSDLNALDFSFNGRKYYESVYGRLESLGKPFY